MILNQSGQSIEIDGTVFAVGVRIGANSKSEYYGLEGRITEIATDDDKDPKTRDLIFIAALIPLPSQNL